MEPEKKAGTDKNISETGVKVVLGTLVVGALGGIALSSVMVAGGILLATSTSGIASAIGVTAAVGAGLRILGGAHLLDRTRKLFKQTKELSNFDNFKSQISKMVEVKGPLQLLKQPVVQGVISGAILAAGISLFSVGGFLPVAAAVVMTASGGFGTLASTGQAVSYTLKKLFKKDAAQAPSKNTPAPAVTPENTPSAPASKLDTAAAQQDFKAAAANNNETSVEKAPEQKPAAPKPPMAG